MSKQFRRWMVTMLAAGAFAPAAPAADTRAVSRFQKEAEPLLKEYCYDCHGDGAKKGGVAFDELTPDKLVADHELWLKVMRNMRAGLMPPEKKPKPTAKEQARLEEWIKHSAFGLDAKNPDPGRVTVRRLNRNEYRNTIRDLTGFDYKVEEELPPDDTGYGFDNIGDVLTMSPLLLEKYMQAAEVVAAGAVPRVPWVMAEATIPGNEFRKQGGKGTGDRLTFYEAATVTNSFQAKHAGQYRVTIEGQVLEQFAFDPGRCRAVLKSGTQELWQSEFRWQNGKRWRADVGVTWAAGTHPLALELHPLVPVEKKTNSLDLRIFSVRVSGPMAREHWVRPKNFELFFTKDPPEDAAGRRAYARDVLERFTHRAYRRPADTNAVERLVGIAGAAWSAPGKRFEDGIAEAIVPVLASPRFLFRVEGVETARNARSVPFAPLDEYSLASRLSYFLWSTMPDEELFRLAARRELRKNLNAQVKRMLADRRSRAFIDNFTGQWLQTRDVDGIDINAFQVLIRDSGEEMDFQKRRQRFQELLAIPEEQRTAEQKEELRQMNERRRGRQNRRTVELDGELRRALREETQLAFAHVVREDRSVLELLNANYTFLNERLAKHYDMTNLNLTGSEMRLVSLPAGSPRGGVLTHGAALIVTSNPTRTSPVKRGLFVLDNILGLPTPPPPPDVPNLEDSEKPVNGRKPTLRETLAVHREKPLCSSCHNRMDPLGLALENFNALGMWRDKERGQPIDAAGRLVTGEEFQDIREVKRVLVANHHLDYYRCLTDKLLTYALGRGLEYYDVETVDQIVARLDKDKGRFSTLLAGVIDSAPFQKRRNISSTAAPSSTSDSRSKAGSKP